MDLAATISARSFSEGGGCSRSSPLRDFAYHPRFDRHGREEGARVARCFEEWDFRRLERAAVLGVEFRREQAPRLRGRRSTSSVPPHRPSFGEGEFAANGDLAVDKGESAPLASPRDGEADPSAT